MGNSQEAAEFVKAHFVSLFSDVQRSPVEAHPANPRCLSNPISSSEVETATKRLKNRRAVGLDGLCAELLKNGPPEIYGIIANVLNKAMELGEDLGLGLAKLVTLPKPGKPTGPVKNIRPIALLPLLRKLLSLITLARISPTVNQYLSSAQAGFRPGRSCADIVWAHRWLIAKVLKYRILVHILGLDMSRAFDTIDRVKLLGILDGISGLTDDDRRLIRVLLANTSLQVEFNGVLTEPFASNIGSPQGDGLSPILFAIYLEAAIRELEARGPQRPDIDINLPSKAMYADDTDFISLCAIYLDEIQRTVGPIFGEYNLLVNVEKTERTIIDCNVTDSSAWSKTRKLGSLLGVEQDVDKRIQLAYQSFKNLELLWKNRNLVSERTRIYSYRVVVESVLLYNCGTWALTRKLANKLDRCQRSMLRRVVGLHWYDKVKNESLYKRCNVDPAWIQVLRARWRLFGHVLRLANDTPAKLAMAYYFKDAYDSEQNLIKGQPGRPVYTIATALSNEYNAMYNVPISNSAEYEAIEKQAEDKVVWRDVVKNIVNQQILLRSKPVVDNTQLRRSKRLAKLSAVVYTDM